MLGVPAGVTPPSLAADVATGLVLVTAAVVAWIRRPRSLVGPLLALTGATWLAGDLSSSLIYLHRGPLVHALLTHPSGRTRTPFVRAVIALVYIDGAIPALARAPWLTLVVGALVVGTAAARFASARGIERKAALVPLVCATATWGALGLAAAGKLADAGVVGSAAWAYELAIAFTAVALVVDLISERAVRATATGLVVDLGAGDGAQGVRAAIARAVGDSSLTILYRADGNWVDEAGRPARLPGPGAGAQVSTISGEDGAPVAAIVHDPAALRDERLARSVAAAVRLAVTNVRLQADVEARVLEVAASRRRLVEASDIERRRLSEQLRAGAEARLARVGAQLGQLAAAGSSFNDLKAELEAARKDLTQFAQGVHPRALTEDGLRTALELLAAQATVPVELDVPRIRMRAAQEAALYFVCSEALANIAKYADASMARISVAMDDGRVRVQVSDDGRGGADPTAGSGLRGLADRVEALGGRLFVDSERGKGTTVGAVLPRTEAVAA